MILDFETKYGAAYRRALAAAAKRATAAYQPGQLTPAPPCRREPDGQLVQMMLEPVEEDPAEERIRQMAARP